MKQRERRFFVVKHDLESFQVMPHFIWRTGMDAQHVPARFNEVQGGDRWVSFAYMDNERDEQALSQIVGFSECVEACRYGDIPPAALAASDGETKAWLIKGEAFGEQPPSPVDVPPLDEIVGRTLWKQGAIIPIKEADFERLREAAMSKA